MNPVFIFTHYVFKTTTWLILILIFLIIGLLRIYLLYKPVWISTSIQLLPSTVGMLVIFLFTYLFCKFVIARFEVNEKGIFIFPHFFSWQDIIRVKKISRFNISIICFSVSKNGVIKNFYISTKIDDIQGFKYCIENFMPDSIAAKKTLTEILSPFVSNNPLHARQKLANYCSRYILISYLLKSLLIIFTSGVFYFTIPKLFVPTYVLAQNNQFYRLLLRYGFYIEVLNGKNKLFDVKWPKGTTVTYSSITSKASSIVLDKKTDILHANHPPETLLLYKDPFLILVMESTYKINNLQLPKKTTVYFSGENIHKIELAEEFIYKGIKLPRGCTLIYKENFPHSYCSLDDPKYFKH